MKQVTIESQCTGCAACANICPKKAIKIIQNKEGFYKHIIDQDKCINCGLCAQICPQNTKAKSDNSDSPVVYAAFADEEIRKNSSSGGAFSVMANKVLFQKGLVIGAALDEKFVVKHIMIDNVKDIVKLRGSKYVQSYIAPDLFVKIKKELETGRIILFSGTSCQVAGLKSFLNGKNYDNLITIDIICNNVPSPKVLQKFLTDIVPDTQDIQNISFRNKELNGWACKAITVSDKKGKVINNLTYMDGFRNKLYTSSVCENCLYRNLPRQGDITLGDFWWIERYKPELNDGKGTSLISINNTKGQTFFDSIKTEFMVLEKVPVEKALHLHAPVKEFLHPTRDIFFNNLDKTTVVENVIDCLSGKYSVAILNWFWNSNRGAILTSFAFQELIKELGYDAKIVNYMPYIYYKNVYLKDSISCKFADKWLHLTPYYADSNDLRFLNNSFHTFICASDQIWRYDFTKDFEWIYFERFVDGSKKKIAYAASFGLKQFIAPETEYIMAKHLINRFDFISTREKDGVDIVRNQFGREATHVLDPVFMIDFAKYDNLIKSVDLDIKEDFIFVYLVSSKGSQHSDLLLNKIEELKQFINIRCIFCDEKTTVEEWLYYIKNAKYVITNSFHASCMSIILQTRFMTFYEKGKDSRMDSLLELTNLQNCFVDKYAKMTKELVENWINTPINYENVFDRINVKKSESMQWIKHALESDKVAINDDFVDSLLCEMEKIKKWAVDWDFRGTRITSELQKKVDNMETAFSCLHLNLILKIKCKMYRLLKHLSFGKKKKHYKNIYQRLSTALSNINAL